jgi:hypothetical protein
MAARRGRSPLGPPGGGRPPPTALGTTTRSPGSRVGRRRGAAMEHPGAGRPSPWFGPAPEASPASVDGHCGEGAARGSGEVPRSHHPHKNGRHQPALRRTASLDTHDQQQGPAAWGWRTFRDGPRGGCWGGLRPARDRSTDHPQAVAWVATSKCARSDGPRWVGNPGRSVASTTWPVAPIGGRQASLRHPSRSGSRLPAR